MMWNSENSFVKGKSWSAFVGVAIAERVLNMFELIYWRLSGFHVFQYQLFWLYVVEYMVGYFSISVISYSCLSDRGKHHKNMCKTYGHMSANDCVYT